MRISLAQWNAINLEDDFRKNKKPLEHLMESCGGWFSQRISSLNNTQNNPIWDEEKRIHSIKLRPNGNFHFAEFSAPRDAFRPRKNRNANFNVQ